MSMVVMSFNLFGSLYAHSADRDWECYKKLEDDHVDLENNTDIHEIAWQLMNREPGINAKGGFQLLDLIITELKSHMTC